MLPDPNFYKEWKEWALQLVRAQEPNLELQPLRLPRYAVADLPAAQEPGMMVLVLDEVGGEVPAFSDSAGAWRRVTDRAVVST